MTLKFVVRTLCALPNVLNTRGLSLILFFVSPSAYSESEEVLLKFRHELTWSEVAHAVLAKHPSLQNYPLRRQALLANSETVALPPAYQLNLELENLAGTGALRGVRAIETELSLSSIIELGNKPGARVAVVDAQVANLDAQQKIKTLDLLAEAASRYIAIAKVQARLMLSKNELRLAERTIGSVQKRVNAGATPRIELLRARAAVNRLRIQIDQLEQRSVGLKRALATLWSAETVTFKRVVIDLDAGLPELDFDHLLRQLENQPDILQFASKQRIQDAEMRLAQVRGRSDLGWKVGVRHNAENDDIALTAGISLPLFSERRNRAVVTAAQATVKTVQWERETRLQALKASLFVMAHDYRAARQAQQRLISEVVPVLEQVLTETQQIYQRGRASYLELISARRELLDARAVIIEVALSAYETRITIERLIGQSLRVTSASPAAGVIQ